MSVLALCLSLCLSACGYGHDYDGNIIVDNQTDSGTPEKALTFRLARFGDPFTGDLLGSPLDAGSAKHLGGWHEDYYDAEAEMELGGPPVEWFDVFVHGDEDNFFDIF